MHLERGRFYRDKSTRTSFFSIKDNTYIDTILGWFSKKNEDRLSPFFRNVQRLTQKNNKLEC